MSIKAKEFTELPKWLQQKIRIRFENYGISYEEGYSKHFPDEAKKLPPDEMSEWFDSKDISHIEPQSVFPEKANDVDNIVLEDFSTNRSRGAQIMSNEEIVLAKADNIEDAQLLKNELSTLESLTDIDGAEHLVGGTSAGILYFSGKEVYSSIKKGHIKLNEAPYEMVKTTGKKSIKSVIIGTCLLTGSPVIVTAAVGYLVVKNKSIINKSFVVAWGVISHQTTKKVALSLAKSFVKVTVNTASIAEEVFNSTLKGAYKIASSETTKRVVSSTAKIVRNTAVSTASVGGKLIKETSKSALNVATHKKTRKFVNKLAKGTVKNISKSAEVCVNVAKAIGKKITVFKKK